MRLYYGCYPFFGYCCLSQEFYYLARWWLKHDPDATIPGMSSITLQQLTTYVFLPGLIMKQIVNFAQWWSAAATLAVSDGEDRSK